MYSRRRRLPFSFGKSTLPLLPFLHPFRLHLITSAHLSLLFLFLSQRIIQEWKDSFDSSAPSLLPMLCPCFLFILLFCCWMPTLFFYMAVSSDGSDLAAGPIITTWQNPLTVQPWSLFVLISFNNKRKTKSYFFSCLLYTAERWADAETRLKMMATNEF